MKTNNRQHFGKHRKKGIPKSMRKKGAEQNRHQSEKESNLVRLRSNFGSAGEGFMEGVGWFRFGFQLFSSI